MQSSWSQIVRREFSFLRLDPILCVVRARPFIAPRARFMAGTLLSYRCGSDSSNLSKCSELIPVQVPVRVLSLEESTHQMKPTLLFPQT